MRKNIFKTRKYYKFDSGQIIVEMYLRCLIEISTFQ